MVTNESGEVAIKYRHPIPRVESGVVFNVQHSLSIAWVPPAKVQALLRRKTNCPTCSKRLFTFASESEVAMWRYGNPRRKPCEGCP